MAKHRPADFGKRLNTVYQVGAAHALFREDGTFYLRFAPDRGRFREVQDDVFIEVRRQIPQVEQALLHLTQRR